MKYAVFFILLFACGALAYPVPEYRIKIAVIDTGLDLDLYHAHNMLCNSGSKSFVDDDPLKDAAGNKHGTNVAGLVSKDLDVTKYCLIILKVYNSRGDIPYKLPAEAITYAIEQKVRFINLSIAAPGYIDHEFRIINLAIRHGIKISVAAGNKHSDLDTLCDVYPACYSVKSKYFHVVGSSTYLNKEYSNYGGPVKYVEDGSGVGIPRLSGTSQATAIHTNKLIRGL